jgi:hypothetical protein
MRFFLILVSFLILASSIINGQGLQLGTELLNKAEQKYGKPARLRLMAWEEL